MGRRIGRRPREWQRTGGDFQNVSETTSGNESTLRIWAYQAKNMQFYMAPWAGKINPILHCDWLPELARWSYLASSELPAVTRRKIVFCFPYNKSFIDQACSVENEFTDLYSVSVHKRAKEKQLVQYLAMLTSILVDNPSSHQRLP